MCIVCSAHTFCEHPLKDCAAIEGEYCIVCHYASTMPNLAPRRAAGHAESPAEHGCVHP
jgi:hypothetical protein